MKAMLSYINAQVLIGQHPGLRGNCTGLWGDCTGLRGNLDVCELTDAERRAGVDITKLIAPRTGEEEETMGAYCRHGNLSGHPCGYCKQDEAKDARIAALEAEVAKWKAESEKWQRSNTIATDAVARVLGLMALSPYDKDRHIHALESALKVAEEALVMVRGMSGLTWTARHYELVNTALFAIKEAKS